jgi:hypothetical protein
MYESLTDRIPTTFCKDRIQTVLCPNRKLTAEVTASRWRMRDGQWTSWKIVDCALLQAGLIDCDMSCLSQLETILNTESPKEVIAE